ncbi:hypothetical protein DRZ77_01985 [Candidatus Woesearchaeota archaeon]|nr:THUMP domain-containing protein [Candidatus Woesearchaeota archaeon]RLE40521.1 MAG: hypothetical protein DRZ77_01985 [Candidatus Woesearchaeota archaeon]
MYVYNLLISCGWNCFAAIGEVKDLLNKFGDAEAIVEQTKARGIIGVKTKLDAREVIKLVRKEFKANPLSINFAVKWLPIDRWCKADINEMKKVVIELKELINHGERWMMEVEKRRYTEMHKKEIIEELASLIGEKVDLENPDKILHVEIINGYAGFAVLKPDEIFSLKIEISK